MGLDAQTGVVVSLASADGTDGLFTFEITIHEVDGPVQEIDQMFGARRS